MAAVPTEQSVSNLDDGNARNVEYKRAKVVT